MRTTPTVLIVEDEPAFRRALAMAIEDEGFAVETAAHGAIALEIVAGRRPDIILLDLNMPVMGGLAFLETYRELTDDIPPVVICSTRYVDALHAGFNIAASVVKPVDIDTIIGLIERLTSERAAMPNAGNPITIPVAQPQAARAAAL